MGHDPVAGDAGVKGEAYRRVLQLVEEVLAMLGAPKLAQSQATDNRDQHKANTEVLQRMGAGLHDWVSFTQRTCVRCVRCMVHTQRRRY